MANAMQCSHSSLRWRGPDLLVACVLLKSVSAFDSVSNLSAGMSVHRDRSLCTQKASLAAAGHVRCGPKMAPGLDSLQPAVHSRQMIESPNTAHVHVHNQLLLSLQ